MDKNKSYKKISELKSWNKNPRGIKDKDFARLKKQIQKLGQYKPLLITPQGEVIGGNMRLKAYQELGIEDVWVSVVEPKDENEKLEYALSDNDRAGYYDINKITSLMPEYNIEWGDYAVDILGPIEIPEIIDRTKQPGDEEWADVFEQSGDTTKLDNLAQITFVLDVNSINKLKEILKKYDGNKNVAMNILINRLKNDS